MNQLTIIGNLARDPEYKQVNDKPCCDFVVAVNRRKDEADFIQVTAWNNTAIACNNYLRKGKKVAVVGTVTCRAWVNRDGGASCQMEIKAADKVEFLSPAKNDEFTEVEDASGEFER